MVARLCVVGLLLVACGGGDGAIFQDLDGRSGSASQVGAAQGGADDVQAGSAGEVSSAAGSDATAGQGGSQQAAAGAAAGAGGASAGAAGSPVQAGSGGSASQGDAGTAGTGGKVGSAGAAGTAQGGSAGAGGKASDLEPKPAPGCPGYVAVTIPHATCVLFRGDFTFQNKECNVADPMPRTCAVASAPGMETTTIVSSGATIERLDFGASGCPKSCN